MHIFSNAKRLRSLLQCKDKGEHECHPKNLSKEYNPRTVLHFIYWDQMVCSRKTSDGCTNVNPNPYKTTKAFQNQRKTASFPPFPVVLTFPSHSRKAEGVFLQHRIWSSNALPALVLTCVGAKMSLEVGTFKVGFPAAWEVANIISPSGKVYLRGTVLTGGNEHWSRGKGQEPGIPQSHDTG